MDVRISYRKKTNLMKVLRMKL